MLTNTLDETMSKAMKYENLTRASKFGTVYQNKTNNIDENELLMLQKISKYVKPQKPTTEIEDEISEYIVEKPEQKSKIFDFENRHKTGLPFFRSIEVKLGETFE
ncbi:MAG: hypothetical protein SPL73_03630 [Cyanobacteriota bacterium]|nr:hypothetical protein [Cyanobacteriota bacterium]MDY6358708.1 hypothetical protein [Cyanobacteriota bacterium]MDY6363962.1 hypothetical protein [Cyanobacteriota bacterium]